MDFCVNLVDLLSSQQLQVIFIRNVLAQGGVHNKTLHLVESVLIRLTRAEKSYRVKTMKC